MKLGRVLGLAVLVLAWVAYPTRAGAQDKTSQTFAIVVAHTVTLAWGASTGQSCTDATPPVCTPNSDPISYNVYWSSMNGGPYTLLASTTALTYQDLDVTSGSTYYYVVTAVDLVLTAPDNQSGYSNQATAAIPTP